MSRQLALFILFIGIVGGLFYLLASVLTPFLIAAILAYLVNPLVTRLEQLKIPRTFAVSIVFVLVLMIVLLFILLLIPLIQNQINNLILAIPGLIEWFQSKILPWIILHLKMDAPINIEMLKTTLTKNWVTATGYLGLAFNTIMHSGFLILNWLLNLFLIPVVTFYLLCDWERLLLNIKNLFPQKLAPTIIQLSQECNQVLGAFFRGQLLVMLFIGVFYSIGLSLIGLNIGIILGLLIGLISIVPYLGIIVGIVVSSIAAFVQFGDMKPVFLIWILFAVGQLLDGFFITPQLVGDRIGLHPVVVIFAILAGGSLCGFFGVLLALPLAAIIMVWLRFLIARYHESPFYQ